MPNGAAAPLLSSGRGKVAPPSPSEPLSLELWLAGWKASGCTCSAAESISCCRCGWIRLRNGLYPRLEKHDRDIGFHNNTGCESFTFITLKPFTILRSLNRRNEHTSGHMLYPPVSRGPRVDSQQAVSDTLHSFCGNLGAVQEADDLLDDIGIPQYQTNHNTPLQTTRLHEHVEEIPVSHIGHSCQTLASHSYIHHDIMTNCNNVKSFLSLVTL